MIDAGFAHDLVDRAVGDHFAAVFARARTEVDHVVGGAHRLFVVLDDDHRVAEVAQLLERREQPRVVALVQADRRLVEDVEHADEPRSDLRRQPNALRLAARERLGGAAEREIVEPDVDEEAQTLAHFLEDRVRRSRGRARVRLARTGTISKNDSVSVTGSSTISPMFRPCDRHRERFALEAAAAAVAARHLDHVLLQLHAHGVGLGFVVAPLDVARARLPTRLAPTPSLLAGVAFVAVEDRVAHATSAARPTAC